MTKLLIVPHEGGTSPEEREHNKALIERYMPKFPDFFLEARKHFGASLRGIKIDDIPDADLDFVNSNMDDTKELRM